LDLLMASMAKKRTVLMQSLIVSVLAPAGAATVPAAARTTERLDAVLDAFARASGAVRAMAWVEERTADMFTVRLGVM